MSDCRHLKPKICGNKLKPFLSDKGCGVPRFVGIEDVTLNQGIGIDLTEGVYAYDGNGNEIPYTVTPDSIDMCDVGEHTVIYRAMAEGKKFAPWFCSKQRGLAGDLLCSRVALRKDRTVTIEQIDPPRIEGLDTVKISPNVEFDPTEGVTAIDGNGNEIEYTYSGLTDAVAEGAIASFETEFEQNAKSVLVNIEPVQNLNGYNNPWIGGSTKNKCSVSDVTFVKLQEVEIDEIPIGIYVFSAVVTSTDTDSSRCTVGFFDANKSLIKFEFIPRSTYGERVNTASFYASAPIKYIRFYASEDYGIGEGDTATYSDIQIERGSTVTPYIPYENICPISGRTECVTSVSGVNVWDEEWEVGSYDSDGEEYPSTARIRSKNYISVLPNTTYYINCSAMADIHFYDADYVHITPYVQKQNNTFTTPSNAEYVRFCLATSYGTTYKNDICINYPSTDHDYHAYNGTSYTTDLGRTVYGGTLDVVSGELVVDRAMVDLGSLTWAYNGSVKFFQASLSNIAGVAYTAIPNLICSNYEAGSIASVRDGSMTGVSANISGYVYARDPNYTDAQSFKTAMSGVQLCYELATPQTYQLTPTEVALLEGQNNVWSDSGDVRVVYQESMPIGESIEYETVGERIITYTATDICGNTSEVEREILVGITAQACKSQACGAFVYCASAEACEAIVGLSATACE